MADAKQRLDRLQDTSGEAWEEARDDLQDAMSHLETAYEQAVAAFEKSGASEKQAEKPQN